MIRKATLKDIDSINSLGNLLTPNFSYKYDLFSYLKNEKYIILVNECETVNAVLIVYENIDCFEVETIVTDPNFRSRGIASELLEYFFTNYCQKNTRIILEVADNNINAINLYQKFGFTKIGIRKKYYGKNDAILMEKVI